jgi:hypothetical protein
MVVFTVGANIKITGTDPVLGVTAFITDETFGPFFFKQIFITRLGI